VEAKNTEVEQAKAALEEKAEQLALTSKYKSEFLANMSHELRTPLNSLLILSKMLSENAQGNLSAKQVEFARNIHSAGADLLGLINDILDLSKIESGTVTLDIGEMSFASLRDQTDRTFSQLAQDKKLDFFVNIDPALPRSMYTDDKRLQQVIKNLLSNAFKFTQTGSVRLSIARAEDGWARQRPPQQGRPGAGLLGRGHRHRHSRGQAADHLRGLPAGRRHHQPQVRRHRPGPVDQPRDHPPAGRRAAGRLDAGAGQHLHPLSAAELQPGGPARRRPSRAPGHLAGPDLPPVDDGSRIGRAGRTVVDDREQIEPGDAVVLIVEDDTRFASILLSLVRDSGFKGVVTGEGSAVPSLARRFSPTPSCWTSACPTWTAWPCWTCSSARPTPATSRCR
jgi:hypothetical protein